MKTVVRMDSEGTLTVPVEVRRALAVEGAAYLELEVVDHTLVLHLAEPIPDEDLWAYTPEHLARVERALQTPVDQDLHLTPEELERLAFGSSK